jgi:uncharacterized membrane protein HdeD (DUF308 family)
MPPLMDYLDALHQGVWEVVVPKETVTQPLELAWKRSPINVPTHGTIASYRNGQYHAHETATDFRVHLDRYDPERNPVLHLVDDAPLVLMIYETMETLALSVRDARTADPAERAGDLLSSGRTQVALGVLVLAVGAVLALMAVTSAEYLFSSVFPGLVVVMGLVLVVQGLRLHRRGGRAPGLTVLKGLALVGAGLLLFAFWILYVVVLLLLLAAWFLASAAVTLLRLARTRGRIPQGLPITVGMGIVSLLLGWFALKNPIGLLDLLVMVLALLALLAGAFLVMDGYGMQNAARLIAEGPDADRTA